VASDSTLRTEVDVDMNEDVHGDSKQVPLIQIDNEDMEIPSAKYSLNPGKMDANDFIKELDPGYNN
jgi:hypothetical protein